MNYKMSACIDNFEQLAENIILDSNQLLKKNAKALQKGLMYVPINFKDVSAFKKCLSYMMAGAKSDLASEELLEKRLIQYEEQLFNCIDEVITEKKLRDAKLKQRVSNVISKTIVPFYRGKFTINLSRQISFLPLDVRLLTYKIMYQYEQNEFTKQHILNRLQITLEKQDEKMLAAALACYLLLKNKTIDDTTLLSVLRPIGEIKKLREDIFHEQNLDAKAALDELPHSISCFVNLNIIHDKHAAILVLDVFKSYYADIPRINNCVKKIKQYIKTKDPAILKEIPVDFLDANDPKFVFFDDEGKKVDTESTEELNRLHESRLKSSQMNEKQSAKKDIKHFTLEEVVNLFDEVIDHCDKQIEASYRSYNGRIAMNDMDKILNLKLLNLALYVNHVEEGTYLNKYQIYLLKCVTNTLINFYKRTSQLVPMYTNIEIYAKFVRQAVSQQQDSYLSKVILYPLNETLVGWDGEYSKMRPSHITFSVGNTTSFQKELAVQQLQMLKQ